MAVKLDRKEIGKRIKAMRLYMGIPTGTEAAELWGYTQSKWSRMENGKDITQDNLEDLAGRCFKVPVEWLMFGGVLQKPDVAQRTAEEALQDAEEELNMLLVRKSWLEAMKREEADLKKDFEQYIADKFGISGAGDLIELTILDFNSDEAVEEYFAIQNRI